MHSARVQRFLVGRAALIVALLGLMGTTAPAFAQNASSSGSGWTTTIYPVYGWAPLFGADIRLPEIPNPGPCDGCGEGPVVPAATVSSNFNGAALAEVLVENRWVQLEGNFLWAGLSGEKDRPNFKVRVDTLLGSARAGVRVVPNLFVYGGFRRLALNVRANAFDLPEVEWKPGIWEPIAGAAFTPHLSRRWRLLTRADYGGIGSDSHSTVSVNANIEWKPAEHFLLNLGYGFFEVKADGTLLNQPIHLKQTLHGPIVGIGIPF